MAWFLAAAAVVLGLTGFIRYAQDNATNRDTALVGLATGWIGLVVLMMRLAAALNLPPEAFSSLASSRHREAHETVNAARNRSSATSGSPDAQPSSPTTPS